MTNNLYSPNQKTMDVNAARGSPMGQMRYGAMETHNKHPMLSFFLKAFLSLNVVSFILLWASFRMQDLFPPHDAPFMSAIGWVFVFGIIFCIIGFFVFKYARYVESQAIVRALTHNRRYQWHRNYDTEKMTDEDLAKKAPEMKTSASTVPQAVGAGKSYFKMAGYLAIAALVMWAMGVAAVMSDLL